MSKAELATRNLLSMLADPEVAPEAKAKAKRKWCAENADALPPWEANEAPTGGEGAS